MCHVGVPSRMVYDPRKGAKTKDETNINAKTWYNPRKGANQNKTGEMMSFYVHAFHVSRCVGCNEHSF